MCKRYQCCRGFFFVQINLLLLWNLHIFWFIGRLTWICGGKRILLNLLAFVNDDMLSRKQPSKYSITWKNPQLYPRLMEICFVFAGTNQIRYNETGDQPRGMWWFEPNATFTGATGAKTWRHFGWTGHRRRCHQLREEGKIINFVPSIFFISFNSESMPHQTRTKKNWFGFQFNARAYLNGFLLQYQYPTLYNGHGAYWFKHLHFFPNFIQIVWIRLNNFPLK